MTFIENQKHFSYWVDEEHFNNENDNIRDCCFMVIEESNKVSINSSNELFNLKNLLDCVIAYLNKARDEKKSLLM